MSCRGEVQRHRVETFSDKVSCSLQRGVINNLEGSGPFARGESLQLFIRWVCNCARTRRVKEVLDRHGHTGPILVVPRGEDLECVAGDCGGPGSTGIHAKLRMMVEGRFGARPGSVLNVWCDS